ncbi:MAG: pilus assembly protein PilC [Planctomycetaceae bacterium]|nr:pilus assembly protein PilC [Planctomycetaceae bacterium]
MAMFAYSARDQEGRKVSGRMEASNQQAALFELESQGLAPMELSTASASAGSTRSSSPRVMSRFYRQLSDLLKSGVPLLRSLRLLGGMKSNARLSEVILRVADSVEDGERLADAMTRHEQVFPDIQISMIRAGERAGFLDDALERLGLFLERRAELRSKVIGNMIYPIVLLTVGAGIVLAALIFFVPRFEEFYADMELPLATRILMASSDFVIGWWPLILLVSGGIFFLLFSRRRDPAQRLRIERINLGLPVIGPLTRSLACARFCRILGTMLENGIPLVESMKIARSSIGSATLEQALADAVDAVESGETLARPLAQSDFMEEDVLEMISVGESANNLALVLVKVAETLEDRVDRQLSLAVKLMEPLLLLLLAGVVLFIFMSLIVPMLQMSSNL